MRSWTSGFDLERTIELRGGLVRRRMSEAPNQYPSRILSIRPSRGLSRQHAERDTRKGDEDEDPLRGGDAHRWELRLRRLESRLKTAGRCARTPTRSAPSRRTGGWTWTTR